MNRLKLEHIIRAAGSIADDKEVIVLGSTSIFAQFPNVSDEFLPSIEADVFPKNKPSMSDAIDGCIGDLSPFHQKFGYYAHGVSRETASNLPIGWENRLIPIRNDNTGGVTGWCIEIHDLVAGKYVSAREKDRELTLKIIQKGMVHLATLLERIEALPVDSEFRERIKGQAHRDFNEMSISKREEESRIWT